MTDTPDDSRFDTLQQEVFVNLWRTYERLKILEDEVFKRYEISAQQYNTLRLLRDAHPSPIPTQKLRMLLISRNPDVTRLVDGLERRNLVERRRPAGDRRTVEVHMTDAAMELLDKMLADVIDMAARQLGHVPAEELRLILKLLRKAREPHEDGACDWISGAG